MTAPLEEQLKQALSVEVPAETRQNVRDRVMSGAKGMAEARRTKRPGRPRRPWELLKPITVAAAIFMLLFTGTAFAASQAAPDSFLYPIKERLESARTVLAWQSLDKAKSEVGHANGRLDEVEEMARQNKSHYISGLLARYETHMTNAQAYAADAAARGEDTSEVEGMIAGTRLRHDELLESLGEGEADDEEEDSPVGPAGGGAGETEGSPAGGQSQFAPGNGGRENDDDNGYGPGKARSGGRSERGGHGASGEDGDDDHGNDDDHSESDKDFSRPGHKPDGNDDNDDHPEKSGQKQDSPNQR